MQNKLIKLLFLGLFIGSANAQAELVTYEITSTVYEVSDPSNVLQGGIAVGNTISGTYTFDISVTDEDPSPENALYNQTHTNASGFDLTANNIIIRSDKAVPGHMQEMFVGDTPWSDYYGFMSWGNTVSNNPTIIISDIFADLYDPTGAALNSTALSTTPPNVNSFEQRNLSIYGGNSDNTQYFNVYAKIDSIKNPNQDTNNPETVTFTVKAEVFDVWDPAGALNGSINIGSIIDGTYTFNTTTPDMEPSPEIGRYHHFSGSGQYGFDLSGGGHSFKTDTNGVEFVIDMYNGTPSPDHYGAFSYGNNTPLANGATVQDIGLHLYDETGAMLSSTELSNTPPTIPAANVSYNNAEIYIWGMHPNGIDSFNIIARIQDISSATENDAPSLVAISPDNGIFDRAQRFDLAIIFQPNLAPMMDMLVTINGMDESWCLFDCFPGAPNNQNRQTFVCPDYAMRLKPMLKQGINKLDFHFILGDGTTIKESLEWEMLGM